MLTIKKNCNHSFLSPALIGSLGDAQGAPRVLSSTGALEDARSDGKTLTVTAADAATVTVFYPQSGQTVKADLQPGQSQTF